MNSKKFKIFISIWPFAIIVLSGLIFNELNFFTGLIAIGPTWYYAWMRNDDSQ